MLKFYVIAESRKKNIWLHKIIELQLTNTNRAMSVQSYLFCNHGLKIITKWEKFGQAGIITKECIFFLPGQVRFPKLQTPSRKQTTRPAVLGLAGRNVLLPVGAPLRHSKKKAPCRRVLGTVTLSRPGAAGRPPSIAMSVKE